MQIKGNYKKHSWYIGILKKFQWVAIKISTDNPISLNEYLVIEFRFLWLRMFYIYDF